jgi:hypothetical protein
MTISSHGSFLDISVSHGVFKMAAQVRLVNLLIAYVILGLVLFIRWYGKRKNLENSPFLKKI